MKSKDYYNQESRLYSEKRYPEKDTDYSHFFFKRRRYIVTNILKVLSGSRQDLSLLEVGCANGILISYIRNNLKQFTKFVGIDIAQNMIDRARELHPQGVEFHVRDTENYGVFDVVIEIGVLNLTDLDTELRFANEHIKGDGYYLCSLASRTSLFNKFGLRKPSFANYLSYKEYETHLQKYFDIVHSEGYGIFMPIIWKVPSLAHYIQSFLEWIFRFLNTNLYHEKIYVLRLREK